MRRGMILRGSLKLSKFTTEFLSNNKYMNFICWNEELNEKNIFAVKNTSKDATGCHRKQFNRITGWQELLFPLRKMRFGGRFKVTSKIVFPC